MIRRLKAAYPVFVLDTDNTTYLFAVTPSRHLEHLYYGGKIRIDKAEDCAHIRERHEFELGNCISYDKKFPQVMLEDMCLEMSGAGHGDIREPFVSLVYPDGSRSVDFLYEKSTLSNQKVELRDGALVMELHYTVYPACDVITRSAVLLNEGDTVQVERLMSMQLDMPFGGAAVTSFHGAWGREMNRHTAALPVGKLVLESRTGCSSNRVNPFFMDANEASGSVYGFNLIYSGNHYAAAEVNAYGKTRIVSGIQPEGFRWLLEKDGRFETPEAVMTYSENGFTGQSQNMHRFVRDHIVRGVWRDRPRPVLLNSWEATGRRAQRSCPAACVALPKKSSPRACSSAFGWSRRWSTPTAASTASTPTGRWRSPASAIPRAEHSACSTSPIPRCRTF